MNNKSGKWIIAVEIEKTWAQHLPDMKDVRRVLSAQVEPHV